jgi:hypothetical protein
MAVGSVFRRCSCVDGAGKTLGSKCLKRNRTGHSQWCYRIELPVDAAGVRRQGRRSGFPWSADARREELDDIRVSIALPDGEDTNALIKIGDLFSLSAEEGEAKR